MTSRQSYEAFKRQARELQVRFREQELKVGYYKYPNVLNYSDARKGLIFFEGFRDEIMAELKQPVAPTSTEPSAQMLTNLLRSEHIPYNIFFPMKHDPDGSRDLFNDILGSSNIKTISDIVIEYHPEPIEEYLDDHTAFDVYVPYINIEGKPCGIGIEVKYTEKEYQLKPDSREYSHIKDENGNTCLSKAYKRATEGCGYYKPEVTHDQLVANKFRQIWRNHMLGVAMVLHNDIAQFTSVTIYPEGNVHFSRDAMPAYKQMLKDEYANTCIPISYESMFDLMNRHLHMKEKNAWIAYLKRRYIIP